MDNGRVSSRPYLANVNSTSSLTLSSISSAGSAGSRGSNPNHASTIFTLTKTIYSPTAYTISSVPPAPVHDEAAEADTQFSPDEKRVEVEGEDDDRHGSNGQGSAPTPFAIRLESSTVPRRYTLFSDRDGRELSHVVPPAPNAKGQAPEALDVLSARGNRMATIRNVNPGGNRASKSHIDIHVLGKDGSVVMAVRGTNSRHVVLVGPKGGRTFMGWMSKQDPEDGSDGKTEKWTINLKEGDDLAVVCWMIVAIDEFYEMPSEARAQVVRSGNKRNSAKSGTQLPGPMPRIMTTASIVRAGANRLSRGKAHRHAKSVDTEGLDLEEIEAGDDEELDRSPRSSNHFPERPIQVVPFQRISTTGQLAETTSLDSSSENLPAVCAVNLKATKDSSGGTRSAATKTGKKPRRGSLDGLMSLRRNSASRGTRKTEQEPESVDEKRSSGGVTRRSIELMDELRETSRNIKSSSVTKLKRWSLRRKSGEPRGTENVTPVATR